MHFKKNQFLFIALLILFVSVNLFANNSKDQIALGTEFNETAFVPGELLYYRIQYGLITAGMASFLVKDTIVDIGGRPHYHVLAIGRSNRFFDLIFKVRDIYQSFIDKETLLPTLFTRDVHEGGYETSERLIFNHTNNTVRTGNETVKVPNPIHDLLSAFYFARSVDFSQFEHNKLIEVNTFFAGELFPVGAIIVGREIVNTSFGKFDCLVIKPVLIEGRVFKDQKDMTMYVTNDRNQIPVLIESAVYVGYVKAELIRIENLKYPMDAKVN